MTTLVLMLVVGLQPPWKIHFQEGRDRYAAGDYTAALTAFRQSYQQEPLPAVWVNIAQCLRALGRSDEAAQAFRRFLDSHWGSPQVRAEVWEALDDLVTKPVPARATRDPLALERFRRGRLLYDRGDYEHALAEFRAGYLAAPTPAMIVNIGQCLRKLDRLPEAAAAYQSFLSQRSGDPQVRAEVWEALDEVQRELDHRMFKLAEASVQFRRFLRAGAGDPELRARVVAVREEVLGGLVKIDGLLDRPIDVQALRAPEPVFEIAREEPRPLLRIHGHPHKHRRRIAQARSR